MRKHPLRTLLLGGVVAAAALAGGQAPAQTAAPPPPPAATAPGPVYDPSGLPATKGTVARYSLTPRGDVDGLILGDGTEVHLPPHLGTQLVYAVRPGGYRRGDIQAGAGARSPGYPRVAQGVAARLRPDAQPVRLRPHRDPGQQVAVGGGDAVDHVVVAPGHPEHLPVGG